MPGLPCREAAALVTGASLLLMEASGVPSALLQQAPVSSSTCGRSRRQALPGLLFALWYFHAQEERPRRLLCLHQVLSAPEPGTHLAGSVHGAGLAMCMLGTASRCRGAWLMDAGSHAEPCWRLRTDLIQGEDVHVARALRGLVGIDAVGLWQNVKLVLPLNIVLHTG